MREQVIRPIQDFPRDAKGLFIQPDKLTPKLAIVIEHNRERMAKKWDYADEHCGDANTYDEDGDYKCGTCNQVQGNICQFVAPNVPDTPSKVNTKAGSCGAYEIIRAGDPELHAQRMPREQAGYAEAANGVGFGCHRCPFAVKSKWDVVLNRIYWCGYGGTTVERNSCCTLNGVKTKDSDGDGDGDDDSKTGALNAMNEALEKY